MYNLSYLINCEYITFEGPVHLITREMSQDGVSPKSLRVYVNDKGMTVKVVTLEDNSPPRGMLTNNSLSVQYV